MSLRRTLQPLSWQDSNECLWLSHFNLWDFFKNNRSRASLTTIMLGKVDGSCAGFITDSDRAKAFVGKIHDLFHLCTINTKKYIIKPIDLTGIMGSFLFWHRKPTSCSFEERMGVLDACLAAGLVAWGAGGMHGNLQMGAHTQTKDWDYKKERGYWLVSSVDQ